MEIDYERESEQFRRDHTTAERVTDARMVVDPGFVHHRKIQALVGPAGIEIINSTIDKIPKDAPEYVRKLQVDQIYSRLLVDFCAVNNVPTLSQVLGQGWGGLFSSIETVAPTAGFYDADRVASDIHPKGDVDYSVRLEYSRTHIVADTLRSRLANGGELAIVATLRDSNRDVLTFEPLLIGGPMVQPSSPAVLPDAMFLGYSYGEIFAEDIDEFVNITEVEVPSDFSVMGRISEASFKTCLAEVLGVDAPKDWGGEQSDLYTSHIHVGGERMAAAFLLKGPARFRPMTLNMLGKNNDQIVRLAQEPARLLIVQHSHEISPPVRVTLRAFTVQPGTLDRRYCCIDGRDSLRILTGYGKLERALELSRS